MLVSSIISRSVACRKPRPNSWTEKVPIIKLFFDHGAPLNNWDCEMIIQLMHRAPTLFSHQQRVGIALEYAAKRNEEFGTRHLYGKNYVNILGIGEGNEGPGMREKSLQVRVIACLLNHVALF